MNYYYPPMMNGYDWGWGLLMMALWLAFFVVVVIVLLRLFKGHNMGTLSRADPLDIAKERYAKGDITKDQFEQLKKDLK